MYFLFPKPDSAVSMTFPKASCKLKVDEGFCICLWVNLSREHTLDKQAVRNLVQVVNQDGTGLTMRVIDTHLEVNITYRDSETNEAREEALGFGQVTIGQWTYITLAYENRNCSA